jgi:hypothetical protein
VTLAYSEAVTLAYSEGGSSVAAYRVAHIFGVAALDKGAPGGQPAATVGFGSSCLQASSRRLADHRPGVRLRRELRLRSVASPDCCCTRLLHFVVVARPTSRRDEAAGGPHQDRVGTSGIAMKSQGVAVCFG